MLLARRSLALFSVALLVTLAACEKSKRYTTTVEILKIRRFGNNPKGSVTEMELRYSDCPGEAHKVIRADRSFSACGTKLEKGKKVRAEVLHKYRPDRGSWRNDVVSIEGCEVKVDPNDAANYQHVQHCRPVVATGVEVGVHCDRSRTPEMLAKCPFLKNR